MVIQSLIKDGLELTTVDVELTLLPGLPTIQFLGLADQQIKESALRIKSAIKAQGFEFPKAKQIVVNLRPNYLKKTSQGLELAVVVAYLLKTEQIQLTQDINNLIVYGELTLSGQVIKPLDLQLRQISMVVKNKKIISGVGDYAEVENEVAVVEQLKDLKSELRFEKRKVVEIYSAKKISTNTFWSPQEARVLSIVAAGEHSVLLAGPGGAGKSTMANCLYELLDCMGEGKRSLAKPHHSVTQRGMLGGGSMVSAGELTRAHGGTLILDEFLEFKTQVLESLREPIEEGVIHLARGQYSRTLPCQFQLVATSNLCPCGDWTPAAKMEINCRFSQKKCRSYAERFSGPLLDRFEVLYFIKRKDSVKQMQARVSLQQILSEVTSAKEFKKQRNLRFGSSEIQLENTVLELLPRMKSERRRLATLRVARTIADLSQSFEIKPQYLQEALELTSLNFERIARWD